MAARRLTTTSYALLGLLATRPMSAYEIARQYPRSMRWSWPLSQAHLYTEPKRLAAAGLVRVKRVPAGPHRTRQEFHITPKGRREGDCARILRSTVERWSASSGRSPMTRRSDAMFSSADSSGEMPSAAAISK